MLRFIWIAVCVIAAIWCGEPRGLTKGGEGLVCLAICIPVIVVWFLLEIQIWNYELRRSGLSSYRDTWDTDQFPQK
jgi:hypothetical protein